MEPENYSGETEEAAASQQQDSSIQQTADTEHEQEQHVPLSALQSERAQRQKMEEELRLIKDHLELMKTSGSSQQKQEAQNDLEKLSDDDVLTVGEFKKITSKLTQNFQMNLDELRMVQKYPDYQEVVTRYLPDVIRQNPRLRETLQNNQDYELAYYLAKNSDAYKQASKKRNVAKEAEKILENSQKAGSLSSMGASTPISQARRYKDMSDAEFMEQVNRNMGYC